MAITKALFVEKKEERFVRSFPFESVSPEKKPGKEQKEKRTYVTQH